MLELKGLALIAQNRKPAEISIHQCPTTSPRIQSKSIPSVSPALKQCPSFQCYQQIYWQVPISYPSISGHPTAMFNSPISRIHQGLYDIRALPATINLHTLLPTSGYSTLDLFFQSSLLIMYCTFYSWNDLQTKEHWHHLEVCRLSGLSQS